MSRQVLAGIYSEYEANPSGFSSGDLSASGTSRVVIDGTNVGIQVHDGIPPVISSTLLTELQTAGMQVTISSATYGQVVGMLPHRRASRGGCTSPDAQCGARALPILM